MAKAKICGLSTPEAVRAALDGGAAFLGFNFFAASPRVVRPEAAARLAEPARGRAKVVAVTVDADDASLDVIVRTLRPDLIQLHGRETPARAREVAARTGAGVIKVLPVQVAADIDAAAAFDGLVEHLMFDTKPGADDERPGGLGRAFDWTLLAGRRLPAAALPGRRARSLERRRGDPALGRAAGRRFLWRGAGRGAKGRRPHFGLPRRGRAAPERSRRSSP